MRACVRGATAAVKSLPLLLWAEAYHPCAQERRAAAQAPAPTLPSSAAAGAQFVLSFSSNWSANKPQCHSDQNFSVSWIIIAAISSVDTCGRAAVLRCRARRAAAARIGVLGEAWHPH